MSRDLDRAVRHPGGVTISVAARLLRVSVHWLRKAERNRLIPRARRRPVALNPAMRWRTWNGEELRAIAKVVKARKAEFGVRFGLPWPPPKGATRKKASG